VVDTLPDSLQSVPDTKIDKPSLGQMLVCSLVCGKPSQAQLQALFDLSVRNNRNRGLTGVLLCGNGVFVHWLEGLTDYLDEAWRSIAKDNRHEKIVVLWESKDAPERLFGDWVMGLRSPIVAQDLLAILQSVKRVQTPKAMLRTGYFEVFTEALTLLEQVCVPSAPATPNSAKTPTQITPASHAHLSPVRRLLAAMQAQSFTPYMVQTQASAKASARHAELSSLDTDASSVFKNSVPSEHTALFDMAAEGMDDLLTMLDMPLRVALGRELWSRRKELSLRPLHWTYEEKLVIVFDHVSWNVGMHPELTSVTFETAVPAEKPRGANTIPSPFRQTTTYALFWDYAQTEESNDVKLPARFLTRRIRLRRAPPIPEPTLTKGHQQLLRILGKGPERFVDLAQAMELKPEALTRLLKPLYAARCIEAPQTT
jgi:Sensors of blue-light using FAD